MDNSLFPQPINKPAPPLPDDWHFAITPELQESVRQFYERMAAKSGGKWVGAWETSRWNPKNR